MEKELKQKLAIVMVVYLFMLLATFFISVTAVVLSPVIAYFSMINQFKGKVPTVFNWLFKHGYSLDGDENHLKKYPKQDYWSVFTRRVLWIIKNKGYSFKYEVCGTYLDGPIKFYQFLLNKSYPDESSFYVASNGLFEYLLVYRYPFLKSRGIRIRLGWKFDGNKIDTKETISIASTVNLFKKFKGK